MPEVRLILGFSARYKLRNNKSLTQQDVAYLEQILWTELGSKGQYEKDYGDTPVTKFVRKVVGGDRLAAVEAFSAFISEQNLNLQQTQFIGIIIDYIVRNGTLERQALQQDPFSSVGMIMVVFKDQLPKARGILYIIDRINRMRRIYPNKNRKYYFDIIKVGSYLFSKDKY